MKNNGITLVEVLVTLIFLTVGITSIFKVYIFSLDHLSSITARVYANTLLDNNVAAIEQELMAYKSLPINLSKIEKVNVGPKEIKFSRALNISGIDEFTDVFKLDLSFSWKQGKKDFKLSKSAYLADFKNN